MRDTSASKLPNESNEGVVPASSRSSSCRFHRFSTLLGAPKMNPANLYWSPAPLVVDDSPSLPTPPSLPQPCLAPLPPCRLPSPHAASSTASTSTDRRTRKPSRKAVDADDVLEDSLISSSSGKARTKTDKRANPPRPANAWICYRSARVHELKISAEYAKLPQADISKIIGQLWRSEPPAVRRQYEEMAAMKKAEHKEKHPDYVFRPVRRKGTKRATKTAIASPPSPSVLGGMPSVFQQPPTPASSVSSAPSSSSSRRSTAASLPDLSACYPTPSYSPRELPIPPPLPQPASYPGVSVHEEWSVYQSNLAMQLPPSPAWQAFNPSPSISFDAISPSQLDVGGAATTFSPTFQYGSSFLEGSYPSSPSSATEPSFDELWTQATTRGQFIEFPSSYPSTH
ncbi:hypothetical protein JCM8547_000944 [Rhodosporidiobolus lusitaniae]